MAETAQQRLDKKRAKLQENIDSLTQRRDSATDSKSRKRLSAQVKAKKRELNDLNQRWAGMRTGIDPKGGSKKRVPTLSTQQLHHAGSSLHNASPFFEGLDIPEKLIMERKFAQFGIIPGDVSMNALAMFTPIHQGGIHAVERDLELEGKQYFKSNASFQEKLDAVEEFAKDQRQLEVAAREAQFVAEQESGGLSRRVEATATPEKSAQFADIERRRLAETTRDIREYSPEIHAVAGKQVRPDISGRSIPQIRIKDGKAVIKFLPGVGLATAATAIGERALAGDFQGAAGEAVAGVVGEIPLIGDLAVMESEGRAAGAGSSAPEGMTNQEYTQLQIKRGKEAKTFEQKLANEAQWAMQNPGEAALNVAKGTVSLFKQGFLQSPMGQPFNYLP